MQQRCQVSGAEACLRALYRGVVLKCVGLLTAVLSLSKQHAKALHLIPHKMMVRGCTMQCLGLWMAGQGLMNMEENT